MTHLVNIISGKRKFPIIHSNVDQRLRFLSTQFISGSFILSMWVEKFKFPSKRRKRKSHITREKRNSFIFMTLSFRSLMCVSKICFHFDLMCFLWKAKHPITLFFPSLVLDSAFVLLTIETSFRRWVEESSRSVDDLIERIQNYTRLCLSLFIWI